MELSRRVDELEAELKIVKNEVQTVLLDIRERILSHYENPFQVIEAAAPKKAGDATVAGAAAPVPAEAPPAPAEKKGPEPGEGAKKMQEAIGPNEFKALSDQLETQKQAFEQHKRESLNAQPAAPAVPPYSIPQTMAGFPPQAVPPMGPGMWGAGGLPNMAASLPPTPEPAQAPPAAYTMPSPSQPMQHHHFQGARPATGPRGKPPEGRGEIEPGGTRGPAPGQQGPRPLRRETGEKGEKEGPTTGGPGFGRRFPLERRGTGEGKPETAAKGEKKEEKATEDTQVNLMTLIGIVRWVEKSIKKVGKERVEAIVEIYRTAGYLPASCKDIIPQVIRLAEDEKPEGVVSMGDSISVLLQLDSLLGGKFKTESAVLSTLFDENGGYPWTKP